jgi:L-alanine-DL-glutamate epimerase-like enolase superfamily enzyme
MLRRSFLASLAVSPVLCGPRPSPTRITRIRVSQAHGRFSKFVAMNAYDTAPKGETYDHPLIRIETSRPGLEGIGAGLYSKPDEAFFSAARTLIGADPLKLFRMENDCVIGTSSALQPLLAKYAHLDAPLLDLVGKLNNKPVWQLLGASVRDRVPAYDGTFYFADVVRPERGVAAVVDECKESVQAGYKGVKLKLGRNLKWMPPGPGRARDIEVVHAVRQALGPTIMVMGDANNGYRDDFENAWNLLEKTSEDHLYWMEELFPETVGGYTRLKDRLASAGLKTFIADGENFARPDQFTPYLRPRRLMDVLQLDIRRGGFLGVREVARIGAPVGAQTVAHNWASQIGVLMALHLSKVTQSIPMVEDDRSQFDVLAVKGYDFHNGSYSVSNEPGLGIEIKSEIYNRQCEPNERIIT